MRAAGHAPQSATSKTAHPRGRSGGHRRPASRRRLGVVGTFLLAALALLALAAPALAAEPLPEYKESITEAEGEALHNPWSMSFASTGSLFLADPGEPEAESGLIDKFSSSNAYQEQFTEPGFYHEGEYARSVAVGDATGDVYVGDSGEGEVFVFKPKLGGGYEFLQRVAIPTPVGGFTFLTVDNSTGKPNSGDVYVVSALGPVKAGYIYQTNGEGKLGSHTELAAPPSGWGMIETTKGTGGLTVDASTGELYIAEPENKAVSEYSSAGVFQTQFKGTETPAGAFKPSGVAVDQATHRLYVLDESHHVIDIFDATNKYEGQLTGNGETGTENFAGPTGVAVQRSGANAADVYVSDRHEIDVFAPPPKLNLNLSTSGTGSGAFECEVESVTGPCQAGYAEGTQVAVSHHAAAGSEFVNWTGDCSGSGACEVTMSAEHSVGAVFNLEPVAAPTVTSVVPSEGPLAGGQLVSIHGTNLTNASKVEFGATAVTCTGLVTTCKVESATEIKATTPAHAAGQVDVTATTPGGTSATSAADHYTYVAAPTVTEVTPSSGTTAGGTAVTIKGTNLTNASKVEFGATAVTCTGLVTTCKVESATEIKATTPAHAAGTLDVTATTPGGTSATSAADHYTYVAAPTVTSVVPSEGPLAGGQLVSIHGTNLTNASKVEFGATAVTCTGLVTTCKVESATEIKATTPAHAAGQVDVTATTSGGTSATSAADHYTYVAAPVVTNDAVGTITQTTAVLGGHVNNNGAAAGSTCKFVVATEAAPGTPVTEPACTTSPVHGNTSTAVQATATGLSANTKYVYRVVAANVGGETTGTPDQDFTTLLPTHTLTITKAGSGSGTVTCNGGACASTYAQGAEVTLAASAASGSTFAGWSGAGCSGTGACKVTINADTSVTAAFNAIPKEEVKPPPPAEEHCVVPKLAKKTLGQARAALKAAHCALGKVTKPRAKKGKKLGPLVVKSSSPGAGATLPAGSKVNLKLGPKPKKKH